MPHLFYEIFTLFNDFSKLNKMRSTNVTYYYILYISKHKDDC